MSEILQTVLMITAGNLLVAIAVVFFILPENILSGGVATVAILLHAVTGISNVVLIVALNLGLFVLGALCLGKKFAISSFLSTLLYPLFVALLSTLDLAPFKTVDPILASFYSGIITGAGLGLVFRVNASTGGMDIPALILHKYLRIPQGQSVLIVDSITILCGLFTFGLNPVLTGLIAIMSSTFTINAIQTMGGQSAQNLMIISEKYKEIEDYLLDDLSRGVTILQGKGAWSNENRPVLMCVVHTREYATVQREIGKIDPKAFVIVNNVHEIWGSGFTYKDGTR